MKEKEIGGFRWMGFDRRKDEAEEKWKRGYIGNWHEKRMKGKFLMPQNCRKFYKVEKWRN